MAAEMKIRRALVDAANSVPEATPEELLTALVQVLASTIVALKAPEASVEEALEIVCDLLKSDTRARAAQWTTGPAH